ncbi:hypothetical protein Moror_4984 [Moniliophthora roreri MCA 2997]|uniref:Deoxyribonuclease NucA/NucB domain-containing protein n=1 Tax=Moniliophthora roreri (strain MCA 2997) TaxID=1381753 RepID=V2X0T4_MONRO|nr:hypothetical protein Moror_4984 [Moniliophthora roreri MCA 2997]
MSIIRIEMRVKVYYFNLLVSPLYLTSSTSLPLYFPTAAILRNETEEIILTFTAPFSFLPCLHPNTRREPLRGRTNRSLRQHLFVHIGKRLNFQKCVLQRLVAHPEEFAVRGAAVSLENDAVRGTAVTIMRIVLEATGVALPILRPAVEQLAASLEPSAAPGLQLDAKDQHVVGVPVVHRAHFANATLVLLLNTEGGSFAFNWMKRGMAICCETCAKECAARIPLPSHTPDQPTQYKRGGRRGRNAGKIGSGGNSSLNSCVEWPPASCEEGGNTLPQSQRSIDCIPQAQSVYQGWSFRRMMQNSSLTAGEEFVISIDCKLVMEVSFNNGSDPSGSRQDTSSNTGTARPEYRIPGDDNSYIIIPFGDLEAGRYTVFIQVLSGITSFTHLVDVDGDDVINPMGTLSAGQSQNVNFNLEEEEGGIGIVLGTRDNSTNVTWTFQGTPTPTSTSISGSRATITGFGSANGGVGNSAYPAVPFIVTGIGMAIGVSLCLF